MITNTMINPVNLVSGPSVNQLRATPAEATESFAAYLKNALDGVAAQEQNVHKLNDQFLIGEVDENQVIIAATQAELSLSLTGQVRNKVIEAYQEIMRMQV
ncbi:flagellar hook-basal body complex protein FliE [Cohnella sp. SGD-V74]|uniref:flagellar hook-basal body complex protein FliE n=1 Tax=unclassified Cohnella TaxID=2636738 RepID=UPI000D42AEED|nr:MULTISPECIES: flagellar hook-basal body complex protein FliE [unclassified Cohnella]PRX72459.1 flagellar hook-basal body complex protein FliE [Cohnella sp. SGD-V74]